MKDFYWMHKPMMAADSGLEGGAGSGDGQDPEPKDQAGTDPKPDPPADTKPNKPAGQVEELPKTKEELEKYLQSESDKRVSGALKTAQEKWAKEYEQKLETEKKEAERLAKMTAAEKEKAIFEKQKGDLAKKEQEIALKEMKFEAVKILSDKKLPISFVDMLATNDADKTKENIDNFEKAFKAALSQAVDERIKASSTAPKTGSTVDLSKELETLRAKASKTGKMEDRVAYAKMKQKMEQAKINEK